MIQRGAIVPCLSPSLRLHTAAARPRNAVIPGRNAYTAPESELSARGFRFLTTPDGLDLDHLNKMFTSVGFPRRDPERIRVALRNTDSVIWVEYTEKGQPVAFARATGDGVFNAIIWDVVVDPSFQGIGLGKAIMNRLVQELLSRGIVNIALYSEARVLGFYRDLGFIADPDGIRGMVYSSRKLTRN